MTVTGQSQGPRENHHPQVTPFKTIWLISRPSSVYIDLHEQFSLLSKPSRGENYGLISTPKKTDDRKDSETPHHHHHCHCLVFT